MSIEELKRPERIDEDRIEKLKELFPEAFSDGYVNIEILKEEIEVLNDDFIDENKDEFYGLNWVGKREARKLASVPFQGTLVQENNEGMNEENANNVFIEGDNLEVLRMMQKSYASKIKMIYIDPPYNTGNDFIYPDNYKEPVETYLQFTGQADESGLLTSNPKASGRYHANWLNMMYPRLKLAKNLLQKNGLIFISIDENEQANLKLLLDEIFGEENYVDTIIWKKRYGGGAKEKYLVTVHEYIIIYARNINYLPELFVPLSEEDIKRYYKSKDSNYEIRGAYRTHPLEATKSVGERKNLIYSIPGPNGEEIWPEKQWWWDKERVITALENGELEYVKTKKGTYTVHTKQYLKDENGVIRKTKAQSLIDDIYTQHGTKEIERLFGDSTVFTFPKPTELIKRLINIADVKDGEIVLDFFAGSGSTGHAVWSSNSEDGKDKKFILVQLPEQVNKNGYDTIADVTKERLKLAITELKREQGKKIDDLDMAFKVFKLKKSNIKKWDNYSGEDVDLLSQNIDLFNSSPFISEASVRDIVLEIMLTQGFPFNSTITLKNQNSNELWIVMHEDIPFALIVCLDEKLKFETAKYLSSSFGNSAFICLDNALSNEEKIILSESMNVKTI
ncbi:site-specific DNA-methyltransferase [Psychrobacillus sp. FSL K6-1415]|uniref:site-specific DNA-methyltransferase n=1 Tax=Psychrobacillus sp. FSL K6-1415 TaxID=2921544 RepID=UPI0030FC54F7